MKSTVTSQVITYHAVHDLSGSVGLWVAAGLHFRLNVALLHQMNPKLGRNFGSLSDTTKLGSPWSRKILWKNDSATSFAVSVPREGTRWILFGNLFTNVVIQSSPFSVLGKCVIKSMAVDPHRHCGNSRAEVFLMAWPCCPYSIGMCDNLHNNRIYPCCCSSSESQIIWKVSWSIRNDPLYDYHAPKTKYHGHFLLGRKSNYPNNKVLPL